MIATIGIGRTDNDDKKAPKTIAPVGYSYEPYVGRMPKSSTLATSAIYKQIRSTLKRFAQNRDSPSVQK